MAKLGERIDELMLEREMTSEMLADAVGVSATTVNRWRKNKTQLVLSNLVALADYFNVSTDYIVCKAEDTPVIKPKTLNSFSARLRQLMKEKGISSYKLRQISRYDGKYFQQWDKGSQPTVSTLIELSEIFDCTIDYLIGREI